MARRCGHPARQKRCRGGHRKVSVIDEEHDLTDLAEPGADRLALIRVRARHAAGGCNSVDDLGLCPGTFAVDVDAVHRELCAYLTNDAGLPNAGRSTDHHIAITAERTQHGLDRLIQTECAPVCDLGGVHNPRC